MDHLPFRTEPRRNGARVLHFFGGGGVSDLGYGIALDPLANPYVVGMTQSSDFPVSTGAFETSLNSNATSGFVTKLALNSNPGIVAFESPQPNAGGWNNSSVTVSFTCIPGALPLSSCTSPDTISAEGASQSVTGTAEDTGANTATSTATVNIDLTAPSLSVTTPSSSSVTVSTPYIAVSGTISDALSGIGGVTCNGAPATVTRSCCTTLYKALK